MQCPKCNKELLIDWTYKEAECESCHHQYKIKVHIINAILYAAILILTGVIFALCENAMSDSGKGAMAVVSLLFYVLVLFFLPKKLIGNYLYKVCEK